jgi:glyoxylase-like metal-dependent hydrolase (beta-lactamase superfamily II)
VREIVDGVWEIGIRHVHAFLILAGDGLVLVDAGLPNKAEQLSAAIRMTGRDLSDVHTILVTHRHPDHIGSLAAIQRSTGAEIVAHRDDVPVITGAEPQPVHGLMTRLAAPFMKVEPVRVDRVLDGAGATGVQDIRAVHTPGHTPGHVSFMLDRAGGVLFVGDAANAMFGRVRRPLKATTADMPSASASIVQLANLEFRVAVFGHGKAMVGDAASRFRDFAAKHG